MLDWDSICDGFDSHQFLVDCYSNVVDMVGYATDDNPFDLFNGGCYLNELCTLYWLSMYVI
jgi:hypothetical protein